MSMTADRARRALSRLDKAILATHAVAAAFFGISGFISANDPGFGDLQRVVVMMLTGLWGGGIVAMAVIAQLITNRWGRYALLLVGPLVGIVVLVGISRFG